MSRPVLPEVGSDEWWANAHRRHIADHDGTVILACRIGDVVQWRGVFYRLHTQTVGAGQPITAALADPHTREVAHRGVRTDEILCPSHIRDLFTWHRQRVERHAGQLELFEAAV